MLNLLTAREAAAKLRIHRTTVNMWHSKGWVDSEGQRQHLTLMSFDANGTRLFDWAELVVAEQQTRAKAQRSHRAARKLVAA